MDKIGIDTNKTMVNKIIDHLLLSLNIFNKICFIVIPLRIGFNKDINFYFQLAASKAKTAFLLFSPNLDKGKVSSLKEPQDCSNSDGITFVFTGYS